MNSTFTPPQRRALSELWLAETLKEEDPGKPRFPGAIGHVGLALERRGLVLKLGRFMYLPGCCFVRFQLTDLGRSVAATVCSQANGTPAAA